MAKLVSKLHIISNKAPEAVSLALHDTADFILTLIRTFAPVDTGWLRDSYQKESLSQTHILIGTMVNYSFWQEYGTVNQKGTMHVTPAFAYARQTFERNLVKYLKDLG